MNSEERTAGRKAELAGAGGKIHIAAEQSLVRNNTGCNASVYLVLIVGRQKESKVLLDYLTLSLPREI